MNVKKSCYRREIVKGFKEEFDIIKGSFKPLLILVLCVLPMTVCYFAIRSLFWLHILILTNNTLYEPIPGLAFLIIIVGIIVLWAVCGALAEGVTTCYKNEAK